MQTVITVPKANSLSRGKSTENTVDRALTDVFEFAIPPEHWDTYHGHSTPLRTSI